MDDYWSDIRMGIRTPRSRRDGRVLSQETARRITRAKTLCKTWPYCYWCGKLLTSDIASVEHIVPLSEGGENDLSNIGLSCTRYNNECGLKRFKPDKQVEMCQEPNERAGFRNREEWKDRNNEEPEDV